MTTESITIETDQLTVDHLVWRRYRRKIPGLVEEVLALNPGLAGQGPYLRRGATVLLPVLQPADPTADADLLSLWD
ncbi:MAG: tail protein X [Phenylobacterium sp.]|nr:tail protein X [Phenylobacterium sp.]